MPKLNFRQTGFNFSICGLFIKHGERIQKFKEEGDLDNIYKHELDKVLFCR